jgi:predicted O-linked N-acetylglucosamine transferase (SPINDLY family)
LNQLNDAEKHFERAIELNPKNAEFINNLGLTQFKLKKIEDSIASFDKSLELNPKLFAVHNNKGSALLELRRPAEALKSLDQGIKLNPKYAEAFNTRGICFELLNQPEEAIDNYKTATLLKPEFAEAYKNMGNAHRTLRRYEEALECYSNALKINDNDAQAHYNVGMALSAMHKHAEAISAFQRAVKLNNDFFDALNDLGNAFLALKKFDDAEEIYERALSANPKNPAGYHNLGTLYLRKNERAKSIPYFEKAYEIEKLSGYSLSLLAIEKRHICDWSNFEEERSTLAGSVESGEISLIPFSYLAFSSDPAESLRCALRHRCGAIGAVAPFAPVLPWTRRSRKRLKLAYLSADYREHAVAYHVAELFERHDRERFVVQGISFGPNSEHPLRKRIAGAFDVFHEVRDKSDLEIARLIRHEGIDIAIDLMGYTRDHRLGIFAYRPAPIQVTYLGYPGSLGAEFMDYALVDNFVVPPEQKDFFTEKLVHLPNSYQVNDRKRETYENPPSRQDCGLPKEGFVFCCFNNSYKITPVIFDIWMRLLHQVKDSVFWLYISNEEAQKNLLREAAERGIDSERLVFAPRLPLDKHLARQTCADLFLDTLPYNAHGTASHALWAGLPLLTCAGEAFQSRVAGGLLHAVGLPELVTTNLEDYEALALKLALNSELLSLYRQRLIEARETAPLFDTERFTKNLETAYEEMWDRYINGLTPDAIEVVEK